MVRFSTRAAEMPFISGMARSRTIRCGLSSSAFSIPSRPLAASPQTSQPENSNARRSPVRTIALSSTRRIHLGKSRLPHKAS